MRKKSLVTWLGDMEGGGSPDCDAVNDTRAVKGGNIDHLTVCS